MSIFTYLKSHAVLVTTVAVVAVAGGVIAGRAAHHSGSADATNDSNIKQVTLVPVSSFRTGASTVSADGVVQSVSQADLKSQVSAPLAVVNVSIGDYVTAGQTIAEFQNADIRAQLDQAKASLALAQGQFSTGSISLDSAKQGTIDKVRDAYIKTYDAVVSQAEPILYNNDGNSGRLTTFSPDIPLNSEITLTDSDLKTGLISWKNVNDALLTATSTDAITAALKSAHANMAKADLLLSDIAKLLNTLSISAQPAFAAQVSTWKTTISAAHSSLSGAAQALTAAEMTLNTSSNSQLSTSNAQVSVAQAGLQNLQAQLAKTVITAPISGKVAALPLRVGELASPGTLIATIVGGGGLQVDAYASGDDFSRIVKGSLATIQGSGKGTVIAVSPSVDQSNKKVQVKLSIANPDASGLVVGENVQVVIAAPAAAVTSNTSYTLPIQNVKIVPGSASVFTVDQDSKIHDNPVILGKVSGDFIEVTSGLTEGMQIVSPVYELNDGETVKVQ